MLTAVNANDGVGLVAGVEYLTYVGHEVVPTLIFSCNKALAVAHYPNGRFAYQFGGVVKVQFFFDTRPIGFDRTLGQFHPLGDFGRLESSSD